MINKLLIMLYNLKCMYVLGTREYPIKIATAWLDLQSNGKMNNDQTARLRQMTNSHNIVDLYNVIQETISISAQMQKVYQNVTNINYTKHYDLSRDYIKLLNLTTNDSKLPELTKETGLQLICNFFYRNQ